MNRSDIGKTWNYFKRNGLKKAVGAVTERLTACYHADYSFSPLSEKERESQRERKFDYEPLISILVPVYEPNPIFFKELLLSVEGQTYENWELLIGDAGETVLMEDAVNELMEKHVGRGKIVYKKLSENKGISENTNAILQYATGDYIGLLDHDDVLTEDAMFEMVLALQEKRYDFLYSDEDKYMDDGSFTEVNRKCNFNYDYLLSNNYICHFLLMEQKLLKKLQLRKEYDGAQDYDLLLRAAEEVKEDEICHIPKVLYHWRCHESSTAANPASKMYAYEAGKRALDAHIRNRGWKAHAEHTEHLGFYRICYDTDIFSERPDIIALGGSVIDREKKIFSGILDEKGICMFEGLRAGFSGEGNKASVARDAFALDARTILVRKEEVPLYEEIVGLPYRKELSERDRKFCSCLDERIWKQRSMVLSEALRKRGRLLWEPAGRVKL